MLNLSTDYLDLPLFRTVAERTSCERCFDTGIWLTPRNEVAVCPNVQLGKPHREPNEASLILRRSTNLLFEKQIWIQAQAFDLARLLTNFTTENPCPRQEIFATFYGATNLSESNQLRKFHSLIEELQKIWLLPVGARKNEPSGYWIITDLADFKVWLKHAMSAPITRLSTLHKVARHNFPVFAEQMEFDFWHDFTDEEKKDDL